MLKNALLFLWQAIIRVFAFVSKEIRAILHQPRLIFSLILGPFLILLIFGIGYRDTSRTLDTLFVVPEGSQISDMVDQYASELDNRIKFAGIVSDPDVADARLRQQEVDLVVVTPIDPMSDWQNDEQSTFTLYHSEVDPFEEVYIRVIGQRYAEQLNQQFLMTALARSQDDAAQWQEEIVRAETHAANVREALSAGNRSQAQLAAQQLKEELNALTIAVGSGASIIASLEQTGEQSGAATELIAEMEQLQNQIDTVVSVTEEDGALSQGEETAVQIETSLEEVDGLLSTFREMDTNVLVAPFKSETLSITQAQIEPMHFYVPAVIALLLQHLAITLAGISIIREKIGGAMELFRAAPVTAFETLTGKYTSYFFIIGVLAVVLTGLIIVGLGMPMLGSWVYYGVTLVALLLASLGIGLHLSLSARSTSQAIQYGMLTLLASIFFSGFFLPLYRLTPAVRVVSWLLPATYGTVLLQEIMLLGQRPQIILLLALLAFAIVLLLTAWFRLSRQMARE